MEIDVGEGSPRHRGGGCKGERGGRIGGEDGKTRHRGAGGDQTGIQSNLYISLASGPEDPMLLERLCDYRGFV